ncbi:DUF1236 domain-containing protein [Devosia sp. XJ19-1]|uniref:DUF1236 domain-containing protein n=1 Tax=Devosia ureilytica TaxID=2952754 RepID=A0A9Q4FRM9_9HYPH|nr:DUF1236 domain-containing protein [Devosia ureilytica]MCP8883245.1 DUF1236 domain-containing protein [Devosia ureilytica]MCP8886387.1 DUF1236 domain-containing protein [Devosia ureilytica]
MKKTLLASVAVISLAFSLPAMAQDGVVDADAGAAIGLTGGAAGGATIGFLAGGPIGAIIGGFAGAVIGAEAGIATSTIEYAGTHPVEPIYIEGSVSAGATVPAGVTIYPVEGDPAYGYLYANGRVWIVDLATNTLVYSPGYVVSQSAADFAIANPVEPVNAEGDVVVGYVLPDGTTITPVPEDPYYGYVYIDGRPALVESSSRTVVWVQ